MNRPPGQLQGLLWVTMTAFLVTVLVAGAYTNITLRAVEKSLPETLLLQLQDLAESIASLTEVLGDAERVRSDNTPANLDRLRRGVAAVQADIVRLRETYVFDNLIQASAFHSAVAPAIADAALWLQEGVSGHGPEAAVTLAIAQTRLRDALQKGRALYSESYQTAQNILRTQRRRLDRFLLSVNLLFVVTLALSLFMLGLLARQKRLQQETARAQADRLRAEDSLRISEQRFRQLAQLLPQTIFEMGLDGRLTFLNDSAHAAFGYSPDDFQHGLDTVALMAPADRSAAGRRIAAVLRGDAALIDERYTAMRKDGSTFPILIYANPLTENDRIAGLRGIIVDISEQVTLREERDKLEEQYQQAQKMEAVGLLAGGVAHDLNNLLSPILGYGELLLDQLAPEDPRRASVGSIHQAGMRARGLIRQLLAFSRKQTLEVKPLDLNGVIADLQQLLRRTIREDIQILSRLAPDLPQIMADQGQIEQVILNLAINAQDAMPHGGQLAIATRLVELDDEKAWEVKPGHYVALQISDTGRGMDSETRRRIFEPFFTTKAKGKGTGLGLSTAYGIVRQHGGQIVAASQPDRGTTMTCYFPPAPADAVAMETLPAHAARAAKGHETIMVVEDNPEVRQLAATILRMQGYEVHTASDGAECLRRLAALETMADLLLTDVIMPDMNGITLYERVKTRFPGIKVLFMSGYAEDVVTHHGVLEEGIDFIAKPFSVQHLNSKVREILDRA